MAARRPHQTVNEQDPTAGRPRTVFIACAALAREVRTIIKKYGWNADFEAVDAALHFYPKKIGPAVEQRLEKTVGHYERRVVVYGLCGAFDLDAILEKHDAVRPLGPHCYEQFAADEFGKALEVEPGTYFLTDFMIRSWDKLFLRGTGLDKHPQVKEMLFQGYKRVVYFSQEHNEDLIAKAHKIAASIELPLEHKAVGYGDLERRLVAIMEGREQPTTSRTHDGRRGLVEDAVGVQS